LDFRTILIPFIYHTHLDDEIQVSGGLYGAILVIDRGTKFDADHDQIFLISQFGGRRSLDVQPIEVQ